MNSSLISDNAYWIPDIEGDNLVDFSDVVILETIDDEIRNIHDGNDTIKNTYYLCKRKDNNRYELWLCQDYFAQGQWIKQHFSEKLLIGKSIAERIIGIKDEINIDSSKTADEELSKIINKVKKKDRNEAYLIDLENDLTELACCMTNSAYRASLALCGRILEISIKINLNKNNINYEKDWMIGKLLSIAEKNNVYCDPAIKNVCNIINQQRIIGVHAKERIPIPSKKQALMVLYAVLDTLDRSI